MLRGRVGNVVFLFGLMAGTAVLAEEPVSNSGPNWTPWIEIGGFYNSRQNDGTGSFGTSRGETTIFAPIFGGERVLVFGEITAKFFGDDAQEGNIALGYRTMTHLGFNLGAWIGVDLRSTEIDNRFWQLSGGFEALSHNFDARLNWYGPVTGPQDGVPGFAVAQLIGTQLSIIGGEEVALLGVDGEIGARLPVEYVGLDPDQLELRTYAGAYHFDADEAIDDVSGAKGRLELRINDVIPGVPGSRLTAEYEISHDNLRDTRHEVGLRLRIPFGAGGSGIMLASMSGQERRMLDGIERDTDIITVRSRAETVEDALTGTDFDRVAFASAGGGVTATSNAAGANSLVIVNGTNVGAQTLQGNQTLQGGGSTIQIRGRDSGVVVGFTAPGAAAALTSPGPINDSLILVGSNTHVSGLSIIGAGAGSAGDGVDVDSNKSNIFLTNLAISNTGDDGVDIDDNNVVNIINLRTSNTGESGISINDNNRVAISGGSITNSGEDGVQANDDNNLTISDLMITNVAVDSIFLDDRNVVSLSGLTVNGVADDSIQADDNNIVSITGSLFTNTDFGIFTTGTGNRFTVSNTTFSNVVFAGVFDPGINNQFRIIDSTFRNIGFDVFNIDGTLFISGTTIAGTVGANVFLFDFPGAQVLAGSTGNVNAITNNPTLCQTAGGSFTGTISFVDGTALQDNVLPCN